MSVAWDEVLPIAERAFQIWIGSPETHWAKGAWGYLTSAQLTTVSTPLDRLLSYVRFLVLASLYRDWCALVWDEMHDDEPEDWLCGLQASKIDVRQLLGPIAELTDDWGANLNNALLSLMEGEHEAVVAGLIRGSGGVDALFVALWRSRADPGLNRCNDGDNNDVAEESDADILNDVTLEKSAGYQWILEGCKTRGPSRSTAESDNF
jgi:hypothetical protein